MILPPTGIGKTSQIAEPSIVVNLQFERSTKGAHRYLELDENMLRRANNDPARVVGTLYVRRSAFPDAPANLKITITTSAGLGGTTGDPATDAGDA